MRKPQTNAQPARWGEWIDRRRRFVGIATQVRLADLIGCSRQHMAKWLGMDDAPVSLRRGYDVALARMLRTDRFTLLTGWREITPEQSPLVDALTPEGDDADSLKRKVHAVVELLDADKLRVLHERGRELLREEMTAPAA